MGGPSPSAAILAADDAGAQIDAWASYLVAEKRAAAKTVEAYLRDIGQFFAFLSGHLGGPASLADLADLRAGDFRAFLASRRNDGVSSRSLARALSSIRSLFRFMERKGLMHNPSLAAVRSPKLPRSLPNALSVDAALRLVDDDGPDGRPWVGARDSAVMMLLYGCGLRISEALDLDRRDAPTDRATLVVTGKGGKTRLVPVLPAARDAVARYLELCPFVLGPDDPLFVGIRGKRLSPRIIQL